MSSTIQEDGNPSLAQAWETAAAEQLLGTVPVGGIEGTVLVAELGAGVFAERILRSATSARRIMCVDRDAERLDRVRTRAADIDVPVFFAGDGARELGFAADVFDCAFCVRTVVTEADALNVMASFAKVVRPGGWVGVVGFGARTLESLDEMLGEAALAPESDDLSAALSAALTDHRQRRLSEGDLAAAADRCGLTVVSSGSKPVAASGAVEQLLISTLIADLAPAWRAVDESIRELGTTFEDAEMRFRTYYANAEVSDEVELLWCVARAVEPETMSVDDADVVD